MLRSFARMVSWTLALKAGSRRCCACSMVSPGRSRPYAVDPWRQRPPARRSGDALSWGADARWGRQHDLQVLDPALATMLTAGLLFGLAPAVRLRA
jgi:hypothetical protein